MDRHVCHVHHKRGAWFTCAYVDALGGIVDVSLSFSACKCTVIKVQCQGARQAQVMCIICMHGVPYMRVVHERTNRISIILLAPFLQMRKSIDRIVTRECREDEQTARSI